MGPKRRAGDDVRQAPGNSGSQVGLSVTRDGRRRGGGMALRLLTDAAPEASKLKAVLSYKALYVLDYV